ncbi:MAG: C4-dicarboxylate transporter DcuC [Saezia sp.]
MSGQLAVIFGVVVILAVIYLLIKQYETRMVLIGAGFLMAIAALSPLSAFDAFTTNMVISGLIWNICSALGFAAVLQLTQCDKHLVFGMAKGLKHIRPLLIPAVALATFLVNIAIPSAAGCAAAVGVVMIPLMMSQGIHPATAASTVMLGTFGSMLSPGLSHNPVIAGLATDSLHKQGLLASNEKFSGLDVIATFSTPTLVSFVIGVIGLVIMALILKENKGYTSAEGNEAGLNFKVNPLLAILPLLPIAILMAGSFVGKSVDEQNRAINNVINQVNAPTTVQALSNNLNLSIIDALSKEESGQVTPASQKKTLDTLKTSLDKSGAALITPINEKSLRNILKEGDTAQAKLTELNSPMNVEQLSAAFSFVDTWGWLKKFTVPSAMLLGAFLCLIFTRTDPSKATKEFFNGMGKGYGDVIGIIIAAGVFVGGINSLGLISSAIDAMKEAASVAGIAATYGPFLIGVVSGSGDAAAMAFNKAVTAHATDFGFEVANMGVLAALTGSLGRTMSPLAGAAILLAGLAKVNPFDIAKRNAPGMLVATVASMLLLLYI